MKQKMYCSESWWPVPPGMKHMKLIEVRGGGCTFESLPEHPPSVSRLYVCCTFREGSEIVVVCRVMSMFSSAGRASKWLSYTRSWIGCPWDKKPRTPHTPVRFAALPTTVHKVPPHLHCCEVLLRLSCDAHLCAEAAPS